MGGGLGLLGLVMLGQGGELSSPIFGMCAVSALWSLYFVSVAVVVARSQWECSRGGRRMSQWSSGEAVGVMVGVCGSPIGISDVVSQNSPRGGSGICDSSVGWLGGPRPR